MTETPKKTGLMGRLFGRPPPVQTIEATDSESVSEVVDQILSYQVDAVVSLTEVPATDARILESNGVALLLYNRPSAPYPANLVSCDHRAAGRVLGGHLIALGHRDFAMIEGPQLSVLAIDRAQGVFDALAELGIAGRDVALAIGDFGYDSGRVGARAVLDVRKPPSALVCISDMMAIGAIDEASSLGLTVPDDLSVASFDGIAASRWSRYQLTTMRQPLLQLAESALDVIVRSLASPSRARETRLLTCDLVTGNSTAKR